MMECRICTLFSYIDGEIAGLQNNLYDRKIIAKYQCGFQPGKSTLDNLFYLQQEILFGFENKQSTVCIFFDIEKPFDRLSPQSIIQALDHYNFRGHILPFVSNFLSNRMFQVRINDMLSNPKNQETGIPQGSVLSPLLLILAINSISFVIHYPVQYLLYADDLAIFMRNKDFH